MCVHEANSSFIHSKTRTQVALRVIGTAEEGLPESLLFEKEGAGDDEYRREAPLQTAGPGFVVDCRGHLIRSGGGGGGGKGGDGDGEGDGEEGEEDDDDDDTRKRLIVGGWMMAKEAGACLAEIVRQAARPSSPDGRKNKKGMVRPARGKEAAVLPAAVNGSDGSAAAPSLLEAIGGVQRVDAVGQMLLRALGRMKHIGGIQCTQVRGEEARRQRE